MSRFDYTEKEMEINKVIKMNQTISGSIKDNKELSSARQLADENAEASLKLLMSLGKNEETKRESSENIVNDKDKKLNNRPQLEDWNDLVAQSKTLEPNPIIIEDIMTELEIKESFQELDNINKEFSTKTSIINKPDLAFLAIATAIQVAKSLLFPHIAEKFEYGKSFDPNDRLAHNDKSIEKAHREANHNFRDERLKKNRACHWINLLYQTPPYDITTGSKELNINMGGKYHRMHTLGHDPILGWIFGTSNILTDCVTFNNFISNRVTRKDPITGKKNMKITREVVPIGMMFKESCGEVQADHLNLPAAIFAQAQHLKSDEFTKLGLPVPVLSIINEDFASMLYKENYDALCFSRDVKIVGSSLIISKFFDSIIALTHGLFRKEEEPKDIYEVRTRKILLISNAIASSSTIINASITSNPKNLDIGSLLNTTTHLFTDIRFLAQIKEEFIKSEISNKIQIEIEEIDNLIDEY